MNVSNLYAPRKGCLLLAFAMALCWISLVSKAVVFGEGVTAEATTSSSKETRNLGVIELTSKNFGTSVGIADGNIWLIEFYTPGCSHCRNFASTYSSIAKTFHGDLLNEKVRVARVNCSVEKALLTRFGIQAFPSFFLVSGWDVYEFEENRSESNLISFARGGYKKQKPISFFSSPMGPMGLLQGTLIFVGTRAMGFLEYLKEDYGISPLVSGVIICMLGVVGGMVSIILLTVLSTPREKVE